MKKCLLSLLFLGTALVNAQVLIDDTNTPNAAPHESAVLELKSNDKGLLIPAPTQVPNNPVEGMIYFDSTNKVFKGYNGAGWVNLSEAPSTPAVTEYSISIADAPNVTEGTTQEFPVTISPALKAGDVITVDYITEEMNPVSASEDSDYTGTIGTLEFNNLGQSSLTISVPTIDDSEEENNETYSILLYNSVVSGNATATLTTETATGTILDNDSALPSGFYQDFDSNTTWNYTVSPEPYNVNEDVWGIVSTLKSISTLTDNFWGMRDLDNDNGGGNQLHTLTFEAKDITDKTNVVFKFDYESMGLNADGEKYGYELFYDDVSQGEVDICNKCNQSIDGTISVNIPDDVNKISVIIYGQFNGTNDVAAIDNIVLTF